MNSAAVDVGRMKQIVLEYWRAEGWNWPVKVMSAERGLSIGACAAGAAVAVSGYVTSEKFVLGRSLDQIEIGLPFVQRLALPRIDGAKCKRRGRDPWRIYHSRVCS